MKRHIFLLPCLVLVGGLLCGCRNTEQTADAESKAPAPTQAISQTSAPPAVAPASDTATPSPIKDALTTLFAREAQAKDSPFPKGTHLLDVDLKDKLVTVNVSKEFSQLASKGESYEGLAQKKLCAALAPYPAVDTMRLTVEGKDYESQASDWRSVPVRMKGEASGKASTPAGEVQTAGSVDR
jgi:hypothetical protein